MDYQQTLEWLFSQLPMFQRTGPMAYKPSLENIIKLCKLLDNPEKKFKSIHIAGTNGKGSTSHFLASILQEAGYKTGLYTSPHLKDFRERIKINGIDISERKVVEFVEKYHTSFEEIKPSFFEMTVGLAFEHFAEENIDIAIIETGLGGRLDSTNVIEPLLSVITNISNDHAALLGNTIEKIAVEKAGIIKPGVPVVIGETQDEVKHVFIDKASTSPIYFADQEYKTKNIVKFQQNNQSCLSFDIRGKREFKKIISPLSGNYQLRNLVTVFNAIEILSANFSITNINIYQGIKNVIKNTGLKGRWQTLGSNPVIICDTGHNEAGVKYILDQIKQQEFKTLHIVWGMVNDKDVSKILEMLPKDAHYYFCKPDIPRGMDTKELAWQAKEKGLSGNAFSSVNEALSFAKTKANTDDLIFVGGSTFVVAEVV